MANESSPQYEKTYYLTSALTKIKISLRICEVWSVCLIWGFTAQSTQWGHVERGQFT